MNNVKLERRAYTAPQVSAYIIQEETQLMAFSGQHNPIGGGGTIGDAKRNDFFDDEDWDEEEESENIWNND